MFLKLSLKAQTETPKLLELGMIQLLECNTANFRLSFWVKKLNKNIVAATRSRRKF